MLIGLAAAWGIALLFGAMEFDRGLLLLARSATPEVAEAARWATLLGDSGLLMTAAGVGAGLLLAQKRWHAAAWLVAICVSGRLLVSAQKEWLERIRPDVEGYLVPASSYAFPSGHSANATITWLALALLVPLDSRWRASAVWTSALVAIAVGVSRPILGVHWPSDVIGGWAFGLFWVLAGLGLAGRLETTAGRERR